MTVAELLLLIVGGTGIYFLLRPLQRSLERWLRRKFFARQPRLRPPIIEVIDFTSDESGGKEDPHT